MNHENFGKTISSSIYRLSDSIWLKEVRDRIKDLVRYIGHNDSFHISEEIETERFQTKVIGKPLRQNHVLKKFKQAAIAIARIKNEFPEMVQQLEDSGDNVFNLKSKRCIFFKHEERLWHIPEKNQKKRIEIISNFVLFVPSLSRVLSFETPEQNFDFVQFRFGTVNNVQLQGAFSKIKGNANRITKIEGKSADLMDIRFLFRTLRDTKTIFHARRLENFSFVTTSDAGENSFKMAFYFAILARITNYSSLPVSSHMPATFKHVVLTDDTGEQKFQMFCGLAETETTMGKNILGIFGVSESSGTWLQKNNYVLAIARWAIGAELPEILYLINMGKSINKPKVDYFYMLAYLNTRKKVPLSELQENFPEFRESDENLLINGKFVYLMQYGWDKKQIVQILDLYQKKRNTSFLDPQYSVGLYFHANHDARRIYFSDSPEESFSQIYNTRLPSWGYRFNDAEIILVENENLEEHVEKALDSFTRTEKISISAAGRLMSLAVDIAETIVTRFSECFVDDVKISSEQVNDGSGKSHYVSNIKVVIGKKKNLAS